VHLFGWKDHPIHAECHSKIKYIWYTDASIWLERPSETCRVSFQNKIYFIHRCIYLVGKTIRDMYIDCHSKINTFDTLAHVFGWKDHPKHVGCHSKIKYIDTLVHLFGWKNHPKHVECHSKIKYTRYIGASIWFYYRNDFHLTFKYSRSKYTRAIYICLNEKESFVFWNIFQGVKNFTKLLGIIGQVISSHQGPPRHFIN
jgi:hypothetical protein